MVFASAAVFSVLVAVGLAAGLAAGSSACNGRIANPNPARAVVSIVLFIIIILRTAYNILLIHQTTSGRFIYFGQVQWVSQASLPNQVR